jgi:hypothetical protein
MMFNRSLLGEWIVGPGLILQIGRRIIQQGKAFRRRRAAGSLRPQMPRPRSRFSSQLLPGSERQPPNARMQTIRADHQIKLALTTMFQTNARAI